MNELPVTFAWGTDLSSGCVDHPGGFDPADLNMYDPPTRNVIGCAAWNRPRWLRSLGIDHNRSGCLKVPSPQSYNEQEQNGCTIMEPSPCFLGVFVYPAWAIFDNIPPAAGLQCAHPAATYQRQAISPTVDPEG